MASLTFNSAANCRISALSLLRHLPYNAGGPLQVYHFYNLPFHHRLYVLRDNPVVSRSGLRGHVSATEQAGVDASVNGGVPVVVITGASRGIGSAVALASGKAGPRELCEILKGSRRSFQRGITPYALLIRMKKSQWQETPAKFMRKKKKRRIVNISSVVGLVGNAGRATIVRQ